MIYMEPYQLGWKPLVNCYLKKLPSKILTEQKEMLKDLFYWLMDPCLEYIQTLKQMITISSQHMTKSLLTLFDAHLTEWGDDYSEALSIVQNWV